MEELRLELSVRCCPPLLSGHQDPIRGKVWSQVAGAEALSIWLELALFPLSVFFHLSPHQALRPSMEECWTQGGSWGLLATTSCTQKSWLSLMCYLHKHLQLFSLFHSNSCTQKSWMSLMCYLRKHLQLFSLFHSNTVLGSINLCPSQPITSPSVCSHRLVVEPHQGQVGSKRTLSMYAGVGSGEEEAVSCDGAAAVRNLMLGLRKHLW